MSTATGMKVLVGMFLFMMFSSLNLLPGTRTWRRGAEQAAKSVQISHGKIKWNHGCSEIVLTLVVAPVLQAGVGLVLTTHQMAFFNHAVHDLCDCIGVDGAAFGEVIRVTGAGEGLGKGAAGQGEQCQDGYCSN